MAPVPPLHVHVFVEQTRFRVMLGEIDWYSPASSEHAARKARHLLPLLKYVLPVHEMHLAVLCVGQELPVAPVPPEHVQTFVEQTRLRVLVGEVDSY